MIRELPDTCRWILLGDFNMVERRSDKSSVNSRSILAQEKSVFTDLKDVLHVHEEPFTSPSLLYSWDNGRADGARVMARLDRIYLFPESNTSYRKIIEYRI